MSGASDYVAVGRECRGLDLPRLVRAKKRGDKLIAQCPACAQAGGDKSAQHLVIFEDGAGRWGCVQYPGDKEHRRQIAAIVGLDSKATFTQRPRLRPAPAPRKLAPPALRIPTVAELSSLADLRQLPFFAGLELAVRAGMLRFAEMFDMGEAVTAWVLLDSSHRCAQARRLDGKPWRSIGAKKAKSLSGSQAAWPIGAADIGAKPFVALCEGGPDTLAAWSLAFWEGKADKIAPVCVAGAGIALHADALACFAGKGIWMFPHRDPAGERAQRNWTAQLLGAGALWVRPFSVAPHKDLNEWLAACRAEIEGPA